MSINVVIFDKGNVSNTSILGNDQICARAKARAWTSALISHALHLDTQLMIVGYAVYIISVYIISVLVSFWCFDFEILGITI